ncbi:MAG: Fic family protein [Acidobacteriaceae bacterium]|nr:Fic family protein [Acidobacteriaceae bacterium]
MSFERHLPYNDLPELPPAVDLESVAILKHVIAASRALERLRGTSARLPNPRVLINGIVLQEARLSSEVENIVTTNDELYRAAAAADGATDPATKEVLRYREALWYGFDQISKRPLSPSLFVELVGIIRQTSAGVRSTPGTNLKSSLGEVIYTPPEGDTLLQAKLTNLTDYIHAEDMVEPLVKLAVMHYQFEAIHPFTDGNGRTGRILNILYLVQKGLLDLPVLYLSHYILRNKAAYYAGLRGVTEQGDWNSWVIFTLKAVEETSQETCRLIETLLRLMDEARVLFRASYPNAYSKDLIEAIFSNPYCRIRFIEQALDVSRPTASGYLQKLRELGLLHEIRVGRDVYYVNEKMLAALNTSR